jgi:hypothetical protein
MANETTNNSPLAARRKKQIQRSTLGDNRRRAAAVTADAPPAQGQESLDRYMGEEKFLIRPPKRRRNR